MLKNIRSYTNQTINLSEGSTVLSGDIGSGKSSLLLAIEFALFGTSRPDLPAEALLRKGCINGCVELTFELNHQEIIIRRNLRKDKDGIKQISGHIINNNVKKELTAIELKAEIINLLGYPEELLNKNKNYIFRYTVYTPQEEMKLILQDNPEIRLDVLRKIFSVDKYKNVRDNLQIYLKELRTKIAILGTKLEPLDREKENLELVKKNKLKINESIQTTVPKIKEQQDKISFNNKEIELLESQQRTRRELELKGETTKVILRETEKLISTVELKIKTFDDKLKLFSLPSDIGTIKVELNNLEDQKNQELVKSTSLREKIKLLQENITKVKKEIAAISDEISTIPKIAKQHEELAWNASKLEELKIKKTELEQLLEIVSSSIVENKTILAQSNSVKNKLSLLQTCPTCLQEVSQEHKHKIITQEDLKIEQAERTLKELEFKKQKLDKERQEISLIAEKASLSDGSLILVYSELQRLYQRQNLLNQLKYELLGSVKENNRWMQELSLTKDLSNFDSQIKRLKEVLNQYSEQEFIQRELLELKKMITKDREFLAETQQTLENINHRLIETSDNSFIIKSKVEIVRQLQEEERSNSIILASLQTEFNNFQREEIKLSKCIEEMLSQKNEKKKLQDLYRWLESYFLPLTYTIEKQVMTNIYHLFNQLFQEWFSILIDDENIYSRLDDSFTPVIEQNGYEISFSNLSGGEKTSASLAYRLALNKVINDVIHEIKTKELIILDEPTDGFSLEQLDKVRDVLERLQLKQTIIVSHESKIESFVENVIRVNKSKQESSIIGLL